MSDLKIGDEILGLDRNTNLPVYSPVIAWLHRDTEVFFDYTIINTDSSSTFLASDLHNIATESNGKILFKFA